MDNKLEAIALLITSREIDSNHFETFINQFRLIDKIDIRFLIFINNTQHNTLFMESLESITEQFKSIEIIYTNIPPADDIYLNPEHAAYTQSAVPKYGYISGPNILFFSAMEFCKTLNTILVIESDCIIKPNVFDMISKYTEHVGDFLISGASYDGNAVLNPSDTEMFLHINGVALYRTGHPEFHKLIKDVKKYIIKRVTAHPFCAYDVAIMQYILELIANSNTYNAGKAYYQKILRNNLIINCSLKTDKDISIAEIDKKYPNHVILHKKI